MFWVHAGSAAQIEKGYLDIAKEVNIAAWNSSDPEVDKLLLVKKWFEGETSGRWILIFDNADDMDLLYGHNSSSRLADYLPRSSNGSILLTTRTKHVGIKFTTARNVVAVPALPTADSVRLLKAKIADDTCGEQSYANLADTLDNVPLALVQAAAYILIQSCSVSEYLDLYNRSDLVKMQLLSKDFEDDIRDSTTKNPVSATFAISFEYIKTSHPLAAQVLSFIGMLDSQAIPTSLIPFDEDPVLFTEALGTLKAFSLITMTSQDEQQIKLFDLHRLVRLAMRNWLTMSHELEVWEAKAVLTTNERFPTARHQTRETCRIHLPHALVLLSVDQTMHVDESIALHVANLQYKVSWYLAGEGHYAPAEEIGRRALASMEKARGQEYRGTIGTMHILAQILKVQDKYPEAEALQRRMLELAEKIVGQEDAYTLDGMSTLAMILYVQGNYNESEAIQRRTLKLQIKTLGQEDPSTLRSMSNLALILNSQGNYNESEAIQQRTLKLAIKTFYREHPDVLRSLQMLASVLSEQGNYNESEAIQRRTLNLRVKVLGQEHPETLTSLNDLVSVLSYQGKYEEAEAICRRTLELSEKVFGQEHRMTLRTLNNLGKVYINRGKYKESEVIIRRALELSEKMFGLKDSVTLLILQDLATVFAYQGKYNELEVILRRILELTEKVLGTEHPQIHRMVCCLAFILQRQRRYREACLLYQRALAGLRNTLGDSDPATLACLAKYLDFLEELSKHSLDLLRQVRNLQAKHAPDSPTASDIFCMVVIFSLGIYNCVTIFFPSCSLYERWFKTHILPVLPGFTVDILPFIMGYQYPRTS